MKFLIMLATILIIRCGPPVPPKPDPKPDTHLCDQAGKNIEALQCKDLIGDPMWINKKGESFGTTCKRLQDDANIFLNTGCIVKAKTCKEVKECPTK